ncbi:DUF5691 domain-containing protein [Thermomonospora curvata]|uniref:Uncharacterized protein n=1 Tax=Thermomonospora curvata (strain ATCC 19995 / DSM 43183 / JCM 3096 / KCTC 9072 / NBRC 15933 / NCIMB 10081 / Henssen B9) TaxID=471852 RepID=D1ACS7_THECD|nr:DUF5691 domain-containing protein [Thermomonospora curvata]ACY97416.1 hypothetical protein Tcur_1843 [Thermomonospora curvata DSM 43183]
MSTWAEHVSTALLGTRRRPVPALAVRLAPEDDGESAPRSSHGGAGGIPAGADPAGALLEQAAVLTVQRRAGRRAGSAAEHAVIAPAPAETLPVVPPAAARRLAQILAGDRLPLLPQWLQAAAERGFRVPPALLPDLLERGRADRSLRPAIMRAAGRRGVWLALHNTDWAYLVNEGGDLGDDDPRVWRTGTRSRRIAYLTRLRGRDPGAARRALADSWRSEPAPDRAAFLATFARGLSPDDEEFLEKALDDRAKDVRQVAADLLAELPGSAYGRRMAERAKSCVRVEEHVAEGRRHVRIVVELPHAHDEGMARDGIPFHPAGSFAPAGGSGAPVGTRAGWLREILARTPLETWTDLLGMPACEVVRLPVTGPEAKTGRRRGKAGAKDDSWARDVHIGWVRAALRLRDAQWARALLADGAVPAEEAAALADLVGLLPAGEREPMAAALIRRLGDASWALTALERIPGPWAGELADLVIELLVAAAQEEERRRGGRAGHRLAPLCKLAGTHLAPEVAPRLAALGLPGSWPVQELIDSLRFRHQMLRELA